MLFSKLFGKSTKRSQPQAPQPPAIRPFDPKKVAAPNFELLDKAPAARNEPAAAQNFDPYNTGSFDKRDTWKRTLRR